MSLIDVEVPQLELTKVSKLTPVGNQLLISPIVFPDVQTTKGGLLVAVEGDKFDPSQHAFALWACPCSGHTMRTL